MHLNQTRFNQLTKYSTWGTHYIADLWGVDFDLLNDAKFLIESMETCIINAGAKVLDVIHHKFEPNGVTVLLLLSESHFSIHTYPEDGYASIDCYTCGTTVKTDQAIDSMIDLLKPSYDDVMYIQRGEKGGMYGRD